MYKLPTSCLTNWKWRFLAKDLEISLIVPIFAVKH